MATAATRPRNATSPRARKAAFLSQFRLREYQPTPRNVSRFLRLSSAADRDDIRDLAAMIAPGGLDENLFGQDQMEVYGRDGEPLAIVGHACSLWPRDVEILTRLQALGFATSIDSVSWRPGLGIRVTAFRPADLGVSSPWPKRPGRIERRA
ncbi:hypothetical protein OJF2_24960 [Aquisphaera giovannonii]|uniref:Uncharacterized protein n=1 Tax=Aquisphaera giovannonii TaxID=406548 RepID=A0A5B9W0B5_9BACT|nr:hypothetical protein [Aquisphaera giovannonii]QEH33963.1 hypothetical protein OJF2_24960 [Aquisphaera giovannonii]